MSTNRKRKSNEMDVQTDACVSHVDSKYTENSTSKEPPKKRKRYSFEEKKMIIDESKHLTSQEIGEKYDLHPSTLRKWKRNKEEITTASDKTSMKTFKKAVNTSELDDRMFVWMVDASERGIPISGPILSQQALIINKEIGGPQTFKASNGWLDRWKKRKGVKNLKVTGEKLSADVAAAERYKREFATLVRERNLVRAQVFNMDESGLQYKKTPNRTFVPGDRSQAPGPKKQLERVTIGTCCNADGSLKLPIILIGKSKNPVCLKNVDKTLLPVWYRNQKNAWMNFDIFEEWFTTVFVPRVEAFLISKNLPLKAVLLVDNCKAHKSMQVNDIEILFFPPNVTSLIQPMDQGIIQTCKLHYGINLVNAIISAQTDKILLLDFLKKVDLYKVIVWIADSWDKVKPSTISECWKALWPVEKQDASSQTDPCSYEIENLDANIGTEASDALLSPDHYKVKDLMNLWKKVQGYEPVDAKLILEWTKKTERDPVGELGDFEPQNSVTCKRVDDFEDVDNSVGNLAPTNSIDPDVPEYDYLSKSFNILYQEL